MASEILQTSLRRLEREGRLTLTGPVGTGLTQFERSGRGYLPRTTEVVATGVVGSADLKTLTTAL